MVFHWGLSDQLMVFHWGLSDCKSPQVSRTLHNIHADIINAVVWVVSTRPLLSKYFTYIFITSVIAPRALITSITVTFMFHSFFSPLASFRYLCFFSLSFSFTLWSAGMAKSTIQQVLLFLLIFTRSGRLS